MNYYIQGDAANADKIKAAFKAKGIDTASNSLDHDEFLYYSSNGLLYFEDFSNTLLNVFKTNPGYTELELPKPHYDISNFHAGMPVLVRDSDEPNERWQYVHFSHYHGGSFYACGSPWDECIPLNEDTKHLLGTSDLCDEKYINW